MFISDITHGALTERGFKVGHKVARINQNEKIWTVYVYRLLSFCHCNSFFIDIK